MGIIKNHSKIQMFRTPFFALACVVATTEGLKLSALATEPIYSPAYLAQEGNGGGAGPGKPVKGKNGDNHSDEETTEEMSGPKKDGKKKRILQGRTRTK